MDRNGRKPGSASAAARLAGRTLALAAASALSLVVSASGSLAAEFAGRVVSVHDGDTLTILAGEKQVSVRLAEIDAPELDQPYGLQARQSLSDLCLGKDATVETAPPTGNARTAGRVRCDGVDVNAEQVGRGLAWVYQRNNQIASPLNFLEDTAQRQHLGLWADPSPSPPWRWRRRRH